MFEELEERHRNLRHEVNAMRQQVNGMNARYQGLNFQYTDPERNFDRSKVVGVAARLFTVKDPRFCVALDTIAGGKVKLL